MLSDDDFRCYGLKEVNAVLPIKICQGCERFKAVGTGGPHTPYAQPFCM